MKKHKIPLEVAPPSPADEIGYWRVSTGRDQTPDMQIAAMKRRGLLDENIYGDVASGRKAKRPNLIMAIKAMRPGGTLVVWKLDRLGRDTMELYRIAKEFEAEGQNIVSMTEAIDTRTAMGRAFFGMLAVFAQFESDTTKERTAAGMARARENGSQVGAKTKFTVAQWNKIEKLLLSPRAHPLSVGRIASRFGVSSALVHLRFPSWRGKTKAERAKFRRGNPLPTKNK